MSNDLEVSVSTPEEAEQLREEFEEVIARVNGDMMGRFLDPADPLSVEREILQAEQSIDYHLREFSDSAPLQTLAPEIKARFSESIRKQAAGQ